MNSRPGTSTPRASRTAAVLRSSAALGIILSVFAFAVFERASSMQEPKPAVALTPEPELHGSPRSVEFLVAAAEDDEFSFGPHYTGEPGGY